MREEGRGDLNNSSNKGSVEHQILDTVIVTAVDGQEEGKESRAKFEEGGDEQVLVEGTHCDIIEDQESRSITTITTNPTEEVDNSIDHPSFGGEQFLHVRE